MTNLFIHCTRFHMEQIKPFPCIRVREATLLWMHDFRRVKFLQETKKKVKYADILAARFEKLNDVTKRHHSYIHQHSLHCQYKVSCKCFVYKQSVFETN